MPLNPISSSSSLNSRSPTNTQAGPGVADRELERLELADPDARRARRHGVRMVRNAGLPPFGRGRDFLSDIDRPARTAGVRERVRPVVRQVAETEVADAIVDRERLARDDLIGGVDRLDLEVVPALSLLLVQQPHHELEVAGQGLEIALPVGGCLDQVQTRREVALDTRVDARAPVVVGADHAPLRRRQGEHGVAVLGRQVDHHATALRKGEGVVMRRVGGDDAGAAGVECPGARCGQLAAGLEGAQINRLAAAELLNREREVRRPTSAPADRRSLDQVNPGRQIALDARIQSRATLVLVCDAGLVLGQQIQVRVGVGRSQLDPDPARSGDLEAVRVRVAVDAEARVAILGGPAAARLECVLAAQRAEVDGLAVRCGLRGGGLCVLKRQRAREERDGGAERRHEQVRACARPEARVDGVVHLFLRATSVRHPSAPGGNSVRASLVNDKQDSC